MNEIFLARLSPIIIGVVQGWDPDAKQHLRKKGKKKFSKKFFNCANGLLSYSKTVETMTNPSFSINLAIASVQQSDDFSSSDDRPFLFRLITPDSKYTLQALCLHDYDEWIATIRNGILQALESDEHDNFELNPKKDLGKG